MNIATNLQPRMEQELISMFAKEVVCYWPAKWGVTKEAVKSAVRFCGSNSVSQVYAYLLSRKKLSLS